jgi:hypothetical protein
MRSWKKGYLSGTVALAALAFGLGAAPPPPPNASPSESDFLARNDEKRRR